jgi:DNA-binding IclR family transcriptional regulator
LLANLPRGEAEERYREKPSALIQLTNKSIKNVAELSKDLEATRERGYSIDDEETTPGVICFAKAVTGFRGDQSAIAVSVTVLAQRLTPNFKSLLLNDLVAMAKGLSNPLAGSGRA